jgi:hypothetical protein
LHMLLSALLAILCIFILILVLVLIPIILFTTFLMVFLHIFSMVLPVHDFWRYCCLSFRRLGYLATNTTKSKQVRVILSQIPSNLNKYGLFFSRHKCHWTTFNMGC